MDMTTAARQYATRPNDERFDSVQGLIADALADKNHSAERTYNLKDLHVAPTKPDTFAELAGDGPAAGAVAGLQLQSPKGAASLSHWAFGQLARTLGAPASYLRELPAELAADCLNYGLQHEAPGTTVNLLARGANGKPPMIRACTSDTYARVWDADLYDQISHQITARDDKWSLPPVWGGGVAGAYRGDRDSFLILTNGGSIVTDPSAGQDGTMYRGILVRNSEVGASSITIDTILFRYICGNHILWGAMVDSTFKRRHVGSRVVRDTAHEIGRIAYNWTHQSAARDEAIIRNLIDREIAHTREAVIDTLREWGATAEQAVKAYETCERQEVAAPRSYWGIAQGLTRLSQLESHQDSRFELDKLAAIVMKRGARVAA
jgi:hypothetical protein